MAKLTKGYTHVYTGNGKGKTTAALGLALRAAGSNMSVFIGQLVKGMEYSELNSLSKLSENITVKQYGRGCFIKRKPVQADIDHAKNGLNELKQVINSGKYDVVILDEINIAIYFKLISAKDAVELIENKPKNVELILTGRMACGEILKRADLVTEMKELKHYYTKGVLAREGIEK
ncbi:MAG: cob(I)yrinic acid a,c-diamide adenosyltransferase [Actinomycetota bacterium]